MRRAAAVGLILAFWSVSAPLPAAAQDIDLSRGGPITVTAEEGLEWRQNEQKVIARGRARAVRENVTVDADRLIAYYRKKAGQPDAATGSPSAASSGATVPGLGSDTSGNEIYRVEAEGNVRIYTPTDTARGDRATYDLDQAVLLMTGRDLRLTTPTDVLTARDSLEYWSQKHMAVARGKAVVVTADSKRLAADVLVAYTTDAPPPGSAPAATRTAARSGGDDPLAASGRLQKVEAFGNVSVRTATETVTGDRAVYVPDTGIARLGGNVRITRGQNQLNGSEAEVNLKTGISRLLAGPQQRVQGLVLPNDPSNKAATDPLKPGEAQPRQGARP